MQQALRIPPLPPKSACASSLKQPQLYTKAAPRAKVNWSRALSLGAGASRKITDNRALGSLIVREEENGIGDDDTLGGGAQSEFAGQRHTRSPLEAGRSYYNARAQGYGLME